MIRRWWKSWRERRELRNLEVYLFNHGTISKWIEVRDANTAAGVWKRWPL
jgi:hypothetical protein